MKCKTWITRLVMATLIISGGLFLSSCEKYSWVKQEPTQELPVSFSANILPFCRAVTVHGVRTEPMTSSMQILTRSLRPQAGYFQFIPP
jgi:hypothetical protein